MNSGDVFLDDRPVKLGRRIGRGGEGDVYELQDDSGSAAKLYTVADKKAREPKIAAMLAANLASKSTLASFPNAMLRSGKGEFLGFRMKLVRDHKPLHELYAPGSRKHHFPQADYRFLVRAAGNVARAVASVHASGCVIGDINHSGVLISKAATASLIDADSFQLSVGAQTFLCKVGVPEYTPPELQGKLLGTVVRTANHDAFGLAVIIFQLLFMGRHPFVGTVRKGDIPPLQDAIRDYRFVYTDGRNVGMDQPPGTPALGEFPDDIGRYFEAAFGQRTKDQRPTAADWVRGLEALESALVGCSENKLHFYPRDADECPWCFMEKQLGSILFVPYVPGAKLIDGVDPGAASFNIDAIWRQISAVSIPPRSEIMPPGALPKVIPTKSATRLLDKIPTVRLAGLAAAVALLLVAPKLWPIWLGLGGLALFWRRATNKAEPISRKYSETENRWMTELLAWQKRIGVEDFLQQQRQLKAARDEYLELDALKKRETEEYRKQRRQRQLLAFLDNFEIRNSRIRGIGAAKQAALASFGVDTAADVTLSKVLAVPGIGNAIAQDLLKWRTACESKFVYSEAPNQTDAQQLANISAKYAGKAATLRRTLSVGPANLSALAQRVRAGMAVEDPGVARLGLERETLRQSLIELGQTPPTLSADWASRTVSSAAAQRASAYQSTATPSKAPQSVGARSTASIPSCPRCGTTMTRRLARRGRNAGGYFWGCSRYPACRGTRNI